MLLWAMCGSFRFLNQRREKMWLRKRMKGKGSTSCFVKHQNIFRNFGWCVERRHIFYEWVGTEQMYVTYAYLWKKKNSMRDISNLSLIKMTFCSDVILVYFLLVFFSVTCFVLLKERIFYYITLFWDTHTHSWSFVAQNVTLINMKEACTFLMMFTRPTFINLVMVAANWEGKSAENSVTLLFDLLFPFFTSFVWKKREKISVWRGWIEYI